MVVRLKSELSAAEVMLVGPPYAGPQPRRLEAEKLVHGHCISEANACRWTALFL